MKVNILKKGMKLVEKGLSPKTVAKLTEGQINTLYNRLMNEQITPVQTTAYKVGPKGGSLVRGYGYANCHRSGNAT